MTPFFKKMFVVFACVLFCFLPDIHFLSISKNSSLHIKERRCEPSQASDVRVFCICRSWQRDVQLVTAVKLILLLKTKTQHRCFLLRWGLGNVCGGLPLAVISSILSHVLHCFLPPRYYLWMEKAGQSTAWLPSSLQPGRHEWTTFSLPAASQGSGLFLRPFCPPGTERSDAFLSKDWELPPLQRRFISWVGGGGRGIIISKGLVPAFRNAI